MDYKNKMVKIRTMKLILFERAYSKVLLFRGEELGKTGIEGENSNGTQKQRWKLHMSLGWLVTIVWRMATREVEMLLMVGKFFNKNCASSNESVIEKEREMDEVNSAG